MYACLAIPERAADDTALASALLAVAQEFSPRVESTGRGRVVCDLAGLSRLFGDARTIAAELRREAADRGLAVRVAVADTRTAAMLLAQGRAGVTVVEPGAHAAALADLPVSVLTAVSVPADAGPMVSARFYRTSPMEEIARRGRSRRGRGEPAGTGETVVDDETLAMLERWGIRTLGALAALPPADLSARLGQAGAALQRLARGEDARPLVPVVPGEIFEAHLDLEWPIEGLEPLSFVLARLIDPLCARLDARGRSAAVLRIALRLVSRETHERRLELPAAMRDARTLRTLALLDLESHPPSAGIDAVTVTLEPTPARVLQFSLLERAVPAPEQLSTLVARLSAIMGQERCGSPVTLDSHRPGAVRVAPFAVDWRGRERPRPPLAAPRDAPEVSSAAAVEASTPEPPPTRARTLPIVLRRYRHPVPVRVTLAEARPVRVIANRLGVPGGPVTICAGPWRSSGEWWTDVTHPWDRDEWDVALDDGTVCRIFQDRTTGGWFLEGVVD